MPCLVDRAMPGGSMNAATRSPQPPLTRSVEDYLKPVFHLTSQGGFATTSDIAELQMIRRHRILESYLTSKLGYDWGDGHVEAERLEHAVSEKLIERMADALGEPRYDPHGAPIPTAAGEIEEAELVTLAEIAVGSTVVLQEVGDENTERLHYLAEQGLTPGVRLTVIDRQPFNGPTIARLGDGTTRVVGQELALLLFCRPIDGE